MVIYIKHQFISPSYLIYPQRWNLALFLSLLRPYLIRSLPPHFDPIGLSFLHASESDGLCYAVPLTGKQVSAGLGCQLQQYALSCISEVKQSK